MKLYNGGGGSMHVKGVGTCIQEQWRQQHPGMTDRKEQLRVVDARLDINVMRQNVVWPID